MYIQLKVQSSNYWHFGENRLLLLTKNALEKVPKTLGSALTPLPPPPRPLIWTKSKRTAIFPREAVPNNSIFIY